MWKIGRKKICRSKIKNIMVVNTGNGFPCLYVICKPPRISTVSWKTISNIRQTFIGQPNIRCLFPFWGLILVYFMLWKFNSTPDYHLLKVRLLSKFILTIWVQVLIIIKTISLYRRAVFIFVLRIDKVVIWRRNAISKAESYFVKSFS